MFRFRNLLVVLCILLVALPTFAQDAPPTVSWVESAELGNVLVGTNGMTVYIFANDSLDTSNCYERCAENWPPLLVRDAESLVVPEGLAGELSVIERTTGTMQVTYNGMPLYYWWRDVNRGDTTGNGVGENWWVVTPATLSFAQNEALGGYMVGPTGMTVYTFDRDETPGASACYDDCATNWPPVFVESADVLVAGRNVTGTLGTIERTDGTLQVTYNDMPLYYFANDAARGETNGQARGDVWWVVPQEAAAS